jgi:hypothetical protein
MTLEQKMEVTEEVQYAIVSVFADYFKDMLATPSRNHIYATKADTVIAESVVLAEEDPGQWAPDGVSIIYHEGEMPNYGGVSNINAWTEVSNRLMEEYNCYIEPINSAVSAVFDMG